MGFIEKLVIQTPSITLETIKKLADEIRKERIPNRYEKSHPNYFGITISPYGKIYKQSIDSPGHPQIMENEIIDEDDILEFILNVICEDEFPSDIEMSLCGILYGYINIDGITEKDENGENKDVYNYKINPFALNPITRNIFENIKCENAKILSETDINEYSDPKLNTIRIPFIKMQLIQRLEDRKLPPEKIYESFTKSEYSEFLDGINKRFERIKANLFKILNVKDYQEIIDKKMDIYQELLERTKCPPDNIIDYLESYNEIDNNIDLDMTNG